MGPYILVKLEKQPFCLANLLGGVGGMEIYLVGDFFFLASQSKLAPLSQKFIDL